MAEAQLQMQAPKNVEGSCSIEGHEYKIPKDGVIKVINPNHVETLRRHGFVEHIDERNAQERIEEMTDKDDLVTFIEERGGEADNQMGMKKLRRLALEAVQEAGK